MCACARHSLDHEIQHLGLQELHGLLCQVMHCSLFLHALLNLEHMNVLSKVAEF
jgi:hypothetical protein